MVTLGDLIKEAASKEMRTMMYEVFNAMEPSKFFPIEQYRQAAMPAVSDFVSYRTIIGAYAKMTSAKSYLEIGTRRGHSTCMVAKCSPTTEIICCDMFAPDYAGEPNPGQAFVEAELRKFGCTTAKFLIGDSKILIPEFFRYGREVDIVVVDGDHTPNGALTDLQNVVKNVSLGGLLVFDDIAGKFGCDPFLYQVWLQVMSANTTKFVHIEDTRFENGWGIAIRTD